MGALTRGGDGRRFVVKAACSALYSNTPLRFGRKVGNNQEGQGRRRRRRERGNGEAELGSVVDALRAKTLGKSVLIKKRTFDQIRGALLIKFGI